MVYYNNNNILNNSIQINMNEVNLDVNFVKQK